MKPVNLQKRITPEQRRSILAMLARGDKKTEIAKATGISEATIRNIGKRNAELLEQMTDTVTTYRAKKATEILDKSENLILRRLNRAMDSEKDTIPIDELNRLTKTAYERSRLETGKPTSIGATGDPGAPPPTQQNLEQLVEAIKTGDEIELQKIIFRKHEA